METPKIMVEWEYTYTYFCEDSYYNRDEQRTKGKQFSTLEEALKFVNESIFSYKDMKNVRIFELKKLETKVCIV